MKKWLTLILVSGCARAPIAGDSCKAIEATCATSHTALSCRAGRLEKFECGGPRGCFTDSMRDVSCDQSNGAKAGEACFPEYENKAQCAADFKDSYLICHLGRWVQLSCPGTTVCHVEAQGVLCR